MLKSRFVITLVAVAVGAAAAVSCVGYHLSAASNRRPPLAPVVAPVDSPFAVLELFTSEGCSSCPPADQLLVEMAERSREPGSRLYPLTFHVDYWDRLGWPDRFADELWSERQRRYALAWNTSRVFTPQSVVNGHDSFVANRRERMERAIEQALKRPAEAKVAVDASRNGKEVRVRFSASGNLSRAVLQIALVQDSAVTDVAEGENSGRILRHANIMRDLRTVLLDSSRSGQVDLVPPEDLDLASAA